MCFAYNTNTTKIIMLKDNNIPSSIFIVVLLKFIIIEKDNLYIFKLLHKILEFDYVLLFI
jgi:hypothetical protein